VQPIHLPMRHPVPSVTLRAVAGSPVGRPSPCEEEMLQLRCAPCSMTGGRRFVLSKKRAAPSSFRGCLRCTRHSEGVCGVLVIPRERQRLRNLSSTYERFLATLGMAGGRRGMMEGRRSVLVRPSPCNSVHGRLLQLHAWQAPATLRRVSLSFRHPATTCRAGSCAQSQGLRLAGHHPAKRRCCNSAALRAA
jgi:hypothetical protein